MASCLGIYFSENMIKYAKLVMDGNGNVRLDHYGTRIARGGKKDIIDNILDETSSREIPVVTNLIVEELIDVAIFDQAQESKYSPEIMKMEFETWCENNQKNSEKYDYVYKLSEYRTSENKHNGVLCVSTKDEIAESSQLNDVKAASVYPYRLMYTNLAPDDIQSYVIVNFDEKVSIETVINRKMFDFKICDSGMGRLLDAFEQRLGSFQKAYSACKQLNVYTEGESGNDQELEKIAEPLLQEILRDVASVVEANKDTISRVYITGLGTVFNNIDVLLTEYLEVKTEILKPNFLQDTTDVRSVSEMLETTSAMVMAYNYMKGSNTFLNYLHNTKKAEKKANIFAGLSEKLKGISFKKEKKEKVPKEQVKKQPVEKGGFNNKYDTEGRGDFGSEAKREKVRFGKADKGGKNESVEKDFTLPTVESDTVMNGLTILATLTGIALVAYATFTAIYTKTTNKMIDDVNTKIKALETETSKVNSDTQYINSNAKEYTDITSDVELLVSQIESGQIGKISTYNVATFLQKIIKVIPKNITLDTVKSDDNKHVKITMYSSKYSDLGYFVAQLKLQGILNNVEVTNVDNTSQKVTIEIGGELP